MSLDIKYRPRRYSDVLGQESTTSILKQYVTQGRGFRQSYLFCGSHGSGKCVVAGTLVATDQGLVPIEQLMGSNKVDPINYRVVQEGRVISRAAFSYRDGVRPTIRITTRSGFRLEGTADHRLRVMLSSGEIGWVRLGDISRGDYVGLLPDSPLFGPGVDLSGFQMSDHKIPGGFPTRPFHPPATLTPEWGRLMGYLIGDGTCTYKNSVALSVADPAVQEDATVLMRELCGSCSVSRDKRRKDLVCLRSCRKRARAFLAFAGLGYHKAGEKRVPWSILRSPRPVVAAFLQGYMEADGHVGSGGIEVTTKSELLAQEIQQLLLMLGVVAKIGSKHHPRHGVYWRLTVRGAYYGKFQDEVGFVSPRKRAALRGLVDQDHAKKRRLTNRYVRIPHQQAVVAALYKALPPDLRNRRASQMFKVRSGRSGSLTYEKAADILAYVPLGMGAGLRQTVAAGYFYDPVQTIEYGHADVFDLNVPTGEMFWANGMVNHNTTLGRILARALLCEAPVEGEPCDQCYSCKSLLEHGTSADFVEVDAATHSGKADITKITEEIQYATLSGKRRIYLFDESHQLSKDALDALLKPLEDSLPDSEDKRLVCIFCTTEPEKMRATVLSRCAPAFVIQPQTPEVIATRLRHICEQEGVPFEADMLTLVAEITECHIRDALKAIEGVSMLGGITKANVSTYLQLDLNVAYIDLLEALGRDLNAALVAADAILSRASPLSCYEKLAEVSMLAYQASLGLGVPGHWGKERLAALGRAKGMALLGYASRFASRPGRPTAAMLKMDLSHLHHVGGAVRDPQAVIQVAVAGATQAPATAPIPVPTPAPVASASSSFSTPVMVSSPQSGTISEQDALWVAAQRGPAALKRQVREAEKSPCRTTLSPHEFAKLLAGTLAGMGIGDGGPA